MIGVTIAACYRPPTGNPPKRSSRCRSKAPSAAMRRCVRCARRRPAIGRRLTSARTHPRARFGHYRPRRSFHCQSHRWRGPAGSRAFVVLVAVHVLFDEYPAASIEEFKGVIANRVATAPNNHFGAGPNGAVPVRALGAFVVDVAVRCWWSDCTAAIVKVERRAAERIAQQSAPRSFLCPSISRCVKRAGLAHSLGWWLSGIVCGPPPPL